MCIQCGACVDGCPKKAFKYKWIWKGDKMAKDRKIDVVILGLLAHEDLTGYDIKNR